VTDAGSLKRSADSLRHLDHPVRKSSPDILIAIESAKGITGPFIGSMTRAKKSPFTRSDTERTYTASCHQRLRLDGAAVKVNARMRQGAAVHVVGLVAMIYVRKVGPT
jgi:hypothetical protein